MHESGLEGGRVFYMQNNAVSAVRAPNLTVTDRGMGRGGGGAGEAVERRDRGRGRGRKPLITSGLIGVLVDPSDKTRHFIIADKGRRGRAWGWVGGGGGRGNLGGGGVRGPANASYLHRD